MKPIPRPLLETLDERILYSADPGPAGLVAAVAGVDHQVQDAAPADIRGTELVFVDSRSPDRQQLLDDFAAQQQAGRQLEVVVVDATDDGIGAISRSLEGRGDVSAIHIVGHGEAGSAQLGASRLDGDTLLLRAGDIAAWGDVLAPDADLLLYGCDVGATQAGRDLINGLAQLTGADVAASDDSTGSSLLGGDWQLEVQHGRVDTASITSAAGQARWQGLLNTYTVSNTADSGAGSLRQAIIDANANSGADSIDFAISGTGVHTISLSTILPTITGTVSIDATTDDSFAANDGRPAVVINVNGLTGNGLTLAATADGSSIRGLVINNYTSAAIYINSGSDGNTIAGNYLGGLDASGNQIAVTSSSYTVFVAGANNHIGGNTTADRNVISSGTSGNYGILIFGAAANGNIVSGNYLSTDASGNTAFSTSTTPVSIQGNASDNVVGGAGAGAGNVIASANNLPVYISQGSGNVVQGNRIGVSASGTHWSGSDAGVRVDSGTVSILDNWIAGGTRGIWLNSSSGSVIQGNRIGTDLAGTANWGPSQYGILIQGSNNLVGGTGAGQGNIVANSNQSGGANDGIGVLSGTGNALLGNSIFGTKSASGALGIDLAGDGVTANDSLDADSGANNLQNYPVLTLAKTDGSGQVSVSGSLNSTASSYFRVELFANPGASSTGYGEGQIYLGFVNVATDASGNAAFSSTLSAAIPIGYTLSATATKSSSTYDTFTDTSEFARDAVALSETQGTITVDTAADTADGDTTSLSTLLANKGADGKVSLREAITAANNTANGSLADLITFSISASGVQTISLSSALPGITDAVIINGATEPGYAGSPLIAIDGGNSIGNMLTLGTGSSGSTLRGLNLQNFTGYGIYINGSSNNTIAGNYLGTNAAGDAPAGTSTNPIVINNGNNNLIGGSTAAERNVIAGNYYSGLLSTGTSTGNLVRGNYFGINAAGTTIVGSAIIQIEMASPGNTIGGSGVGQGNVISGKLTDVWDFIDLWEVASNTVIQGNIIGLNAAGTAALTSTGNDGIYIRSNNNLIGGTNPGEGNVIGGVVKYGIHIANSGSGGSGNIIQGNYIGTDISGTVTIANGLGGVAIDTNANSNLIGGVVAGAGNLIAGNTGNGVLLRSSAGSGNSILGNSISNSSALGINLQGGTENGSGVTANDVGDADSGPNNLQNHPVLTSAFFSGGDTTVTGTLNSTASTSYRIEFFSSPTADASGHGEASTYLGFVKVTTDASGDASFTAMLSGVLVPAGHAVTATATVDVGGGNYGSTSEFSANVLLVANTAPTITQGATTGMGAAYPEDSASAGFPVFGVIGAVNWSDPDAGAVRGMALTGTTGNGTWQYSTDLATWHDVGAVSGSNALLLSDTSWLRYVGDGANAESPTIQFRAWDMSSGTTSTNAAPSYVSPDAGGGTSAFSSQTANGFTVITGVNDAPVLTPASPVLAGISEDQTSNGGQTVASILGASVTDVDDGAQQGIAVVATTDGNGSWQFSTNDGASWSAVGVVSDGNALLLRAEDKIRFVPDGLNSTSASISYRAWDQSSGAAGSKADSSSNGGTTAFSVATDTASLTASAVNDPPVITSSATASLAENTTAVLTVTATDVDLPAQPLSYSITGGTDAALFQIDANTGALSFISAPDFEAPTDTGGNNVYDVTVQVSDGAGGSASQSIAVTVTPVNDNAPVITGSATTSVAENSIAVLTVTATDADQPAQPLSYAISGGADAALFQIDANTGALSFVSAPDFETPTDAGGDNVYNVTVRVSDGAGGSTSQAIAVTVTPTNDNAPVITSSATANVAENSTAVLTVTATDADQPAQPLSYAISGGADAALFQIDANTGALSFISAPDFETPTDAGGNNVYDVTVQVTDGAGSTSSQAIAVTVTDLNDNAPVITSGNTASVAENTTAVLTVTATDVDLPAQTLSYSISGGADAALFQIDANTGVLSFLSAPDFEVPTDAGGNNVYNVTMQVSDGAGGSTSQVITVTVTQVNDNAPVITSSATASVTENNTSVLTVTATDADQPAQTLSYTISGGADAALFQIDANTGALSFVSEPDFETPTDAGGDNVYNVTVQVSDGAGGTTDQAIAVTVTDSNDNAPVITSSATANVVENSTAVLTVTATDADQPAQTLSYAITGGADAALFQIDANIGVLSFITAPDFEAPADAGGNNVYDVTVQVSDGAGGSASQAIAVTVTPTNDNAPMITSSSTASVQEGGAVVLTVTATDADQPAQPLSYAISGGADAALFQIDANTGTLSFVSAPDFETPTDAGGDNVYNVTIQVSDGVGGTTDQAITVTVTGANDNAPVITSSATASVTENNTAVLTVTATDADQPAQPLSYAISGGADAALFQIDANTGALSFITAPDFEVPTDTGGNNVYNVTVQVSDGAGGTTDQAIAVTVTDSNDNAPVITSSATANAVENSTAVLTVTATDADQPGQTLSYAISGGGDAALFQINANTGALSFISAPDFETPADAGANNVYNVMVQVNDGAGGSTSQAIAVTVTPTNDNAPVITSSRSANVAENSTAVLTVTATDADQPAQPLSYAISGGADAALFQIDANTGALSFISAPDFEVPADADGDRHYEVVLTVSDGNLDSSVLLTVSVTDLGETPGDNDGRVSVREDEIYIFTASDLGLDAAAKQPLSVQITVLPSQGALVLGGEAVAQGQWISQADIVGGRLGYLSPQDQNGSDYTSFGFRLRDETSGLAGQGHSMVIDVVPLNDLPVLTTAVLEINQGGQTSVPANVLRIHDVDTSPAALRLVVDQAEHGHFAYSTAPGTPVSQFSLADLESGRVIFVHDDSAALPIVRIHADDGQDSSPSLLMGMSYLPVTGSTPTPPSVQTPPGAPAQEPQQPAQLPQQGVTPPLAPPAYPARPAAPELAAQGAEMPGHAGDGTAATIPMASSLAPDLPNGRHIITMTTLRLERAQIMLTLGHDIGGALMEFLLSGDVPGRSVGGGGEGIDRAAFVSGTAPSPRDDNAYADAQLALQAVRMSGFVLSIGTIWWAIRASGLVASMLMAAPAWITFDPLPVLGPKDKDESHWGEADDAGSAPDEGNVEEMFELVDDRGAWS
ncbi:cadherin domain-containing protein [Zoogloea dura]|uniref:DUF4347 domain-containing protein n=1 Tax=Zoogloea dura TaxID=2728840 RepID=A0A848FWU0_9RHOO|nr:cadherin domain-containing protein [Zoogloea dura]NML24397.1 DUF4347 domain-containing protein [Zoogloea dura]